MRDSGSNVSLALLRRPLAITVTSMTLSLFCFVFISPAQANFQDTWNQFWLEFRRMPPPSPYRRGGGRGPGEPCPIAPLALPDVAKVWSDRPTFVWSGAVEKIVVKLPDSENEIWNASVTGLDHVTYTGTALQPGTTYQWVIFTSDYGDEPQRIISFQVMTPQERSQIAQQLPEMKPEELAAIERAHYFAEQGLWSDFWREVLAVEQPSDKLSHLIDQTFTAVCEGA